VLRPIYEFSEYDSEVHEPLDKRVSAYLQGLSWALHDDTGSLPVYRDVSGSLGHAYYWVGHVALQQKYKSSTYFKGNAWHPTKGMTGKAWSSDLDKSTRGVFALVTRASKVLDVSKNWKTWFRAKESFLGKEIKKALPHEGTEILSVREKEYLSTYYKQPIKEYRQFLKELESPSAELMLALTEKIKEVGKSLHPLCEAVERTISHRLSSAYPSNKRDRLKAKKKPIKEVLSELDANMYIYVMDPLVLAGLKPFRIDNPDERPLEELNWFELNSSYSKRIGSVESTSPGLADIARSFQAASFYSLQPENKE
jgi:hypothetical protein